MHPCLLKIKARMRRHSWLPEDVKSTDYCVFNQVCPGVPVAAIDKVGCPRSPATSTQRICFRTIGLMLFDKGHINDVLCFMWWAFFGVVPFLSYWPQSSPKLQKNHFFEKNDPLTEKILNFATKGFTGTWIYVFLPSFAKIGKSHLTRRGA